MLTIAYTVCRMSAMSVGTPKRNEIRKVHIKPYFTPHLLEEFRGIAKALDIELEEAIEVHIMTEGFKGIGA